MLHIQENISLKNHNTFHIDAKARFFVEVKNEDEFAELMHSEIWNQYPHFFLGLGANILFTKDFDGIIVKNKILGKAILREEHDVIYLKVGAGESRPALVNRCVEHGYQGLENLSLIPGTVGGSPVGNIGAYGTEVKETIDQIEYIDLIDQHTKTIKNADCKFAYRESIFKHELKNKVFITHVIFALKKVKDITPLQEAVASVIAQRQAKLPDPAQTGTAGSFFKNPVITKEKYLQLKKTYPELIGNETNPPPTPPLSRRGEFGQGSSLDFNPAKLGKGRLGGTGNNVERFVKLSAGQLIELCGLKGYVQGNVAVSAQHALVLINLGHCTGQEILDLANHIISEVKKNFGITLDPEVIIM